MREYTHEHPQWPYAHLHSLNILHQLQLVGGRQGRGGRCIPIVNGIFLYVPIIENAVLIC